MPSTFIGDLIFKIFKALFGLGHVGLLDYCMFSLFSVPLSLVNLVPVIGQIISAIGFEVYFALYFSQMVLRATTNRRDPFDINHLYEPWRAVMRDKYLWFGFGIMGSLLSHFPIVNAFVGTYGIIGSTRLYIRLEWHNCIPTY